MIFGFFPYFLFVCTGCAVALFTNFDIQTNESTDTIVLSQIISNYIRQYLSEKTIFISLVHVASKKNLLHFHEELITNLFYSSNLTDFSYNSGSTLIARHRLRRQAFNIVFIDDTNALRQAYLTFKPLLDSIFHIIYFESAKFWTRITPKCPIHLKDS